MMKINKSNHLWIMRAPNVLCTNSKTNTSHGICANYFIVIVSCFLLVIYYYLTKKTTAVWLILTGMQKKMGLSDFLKVFLCMTTQSQTSVYTVYIYIYTYTVNIYIHTYRQYLTEMSTPLTFVKLFYYIFSCDNTEEMTLCYNVK